MLEFRNILVLQTAFLGDVILTLPLVQVLKRILPSASIDMMVIPKAGELLKNHPDIREILIYDKRNADAGIFGFFKIRDKLLKKNYDIAFVPHRSIRSAAVVMLAGIPLRVGFNISAGRMLLNRIVSYNGSKHEIKRNLQLLSGIGSDNGSLLSWEKELESPRIFPSETDYLKVSRWLNENGILSSERIIGIAPATIWNTKRWLKDRFAELAQRLTNEDFYVILIGGEDDIDLCHDILKSTNSDNIYSTAGKFTLLESAALIKRCSVLVTNDSAPMHIATAMQIPVVSIFGATVPAFGFGPINEDDIVVEVNNLRCRPCSIHGSDKCPIKTFDCMMKITVDMVYDKIMVVLDKICKFS